MAKKKLNADDIKIDIEAYKLKTFKTALDQAKIKYEDRPGISKDHVTIYIIGPFDKNEADKILKTIDKAHKDAGKPKQKVDRANRKERD